MISYKDGSVDIKTVYTVEYIDNKKDLDYINSGSIAYGEPWERYKTKQFDNLDDAISQYMIYYFSKDIYVLKLFEEIKLNGETVRESYFEPILGLGGAIRRYINNSNKEEKDNIKQLEEENKKYKDFLLKHNIDPINIIYDK